MSVTLDDEHRMQLPSRNGSKRAPAAARVLGMVLCIDWCIMARKLSLAKSKKDQSHYAMCVGTKALR